MSERMWPEAPELKSRLEILAETIAVLQEEYAVFAVDRMLQMTEIEYRKMVEIKKRIPSLDSYEDSELNEEVVLAQLFLTEVVDDSLKEMEAYYAEQGDKWDEPIA